MAHIQSIKFSDDKHILLLLFQGYSSIIPCIARLWDRYDNWYDARAVRDNYDGYGG